MSKNTTLVAPSAVRPLKTFIVNGVPGLPTVQAAQLGRAAWIVTRHLATIAEADLDFDSVIDDDATPRHYARVLEGTKVVATIHRNIDAA